MKKNDRKMRLDAQIVEKCAAFRKLLHKNAELSCKETKTKALLIDFLRENTSLDIVDMGAWFYAKRISASASADKKRIAFRADMDALPIDEGERFSYASETRGVSHKCGHDGHLASLAAFALYLDSHPCGNDVFLLFQHAEETGAGAFVCREMIEKEHIDEIYGYHNMPGFPLGSVAVHTGCAAFASKGIIIRFNGKNSHASQPENGVNPAFALAETVMSIPALVEAAAGEKNLKRDTPMSASGEYGTVMCTIIGASISSREDAERSPAFGTSAGTGELLLTVRAEREERMKRLEADIRAEAERAAKAYSLGAHIECTEEFPETRNTDGCAGKVREAAERLGIPLAKWDEPFRSSEDFGYYTKSTRGALFYIGGGEDHAPLHTPEYDFPDAIIKTAAEMFAELAYNC